MSFDKDNWAVLAFHKGRKLALALVKLAKERKLERRRKVFGHQRNGIAGVSNLAEMLS